MQSHSLTVKRNARIYTLGEISDKTQYIWLVLHGYSMLAKYFIQKFSGLDLEKNYIVAPEALSRFYQNGFSGRVGASWMTSEDRLNEIEDYIDYLNRVYNTYIEPFKKDKKIILLGFSQGVSTLFRWFNSQHFQTHRVIAWAGSIPMDVLKEYKTKSIPVEVVYGDKDSFLTKDIIENHMQTLNELNINFEVHKYNGGHDITHDEIIRLMRHK